MAPAKKSQIFLQLFRVTSNNGATHYLSKECTKRFFRFGVGDKLIFITYTMVNLMEKLSTFGEINK